MYDIYYICMIEIFQNFFWSVLIRKVLNDVESERLDTVINLQTIKFFNLTLILFVPTDCFACLGSSGGS